MSNSYDQIATVSIDIATTIVDTASFDNILLIGSLPKVSPETAPAKCGVYSSIEEVAKAGWVTTGEGADPIGVAARVAFSQSPSPAQIYIAPRQTTRESEAEEYAVDTLQRALATPGWYVVCPVGVNDEELATLAEYVETQEKMMVYTELKFFGAGDERADKPTLDRTFNRTIGVFGKETSDQLDKDIPDANKYEGVAFVAAWLAHEAGSETAAFKQLFGVNPSMLTSTEMSSLKANSINYLTTIGGKNVTMVGQVLSGEWCDVIRFRDWLKNDMQVAVASLFLAQPKLPFTDAGIALIQNAMEASLQRGQQAGGIAETTFDDDGNQSLGYVISVPTAASVTDNQKAARELKNCKFVAKMAGAIHFTEIRGSLAYSI